MYPYVVYGFLVLAMVFAKNKMKIINFVFFMINAIFIISLLKSIYHCPRPYWVNRDIEPLERYAEYGNPSGHVGIGWICVTYLIERTLYRRKLYIHYNAEDKIKPTFNVFFIILIHLIMISGIAFSRIYLGMHSLD